MSNDSKRAELQVLRARVAELEAELSIDEHAGTWAPSDYYTTYHLLAGMVLGFFAAVVSLAFNVIAAPMFGEEPFRLIRIYLTFPLGERALNLDAVNDGFVLAAGCCLYLLTGMLGGIPFHMVLTRFFGESSAIKRFSVATLLGIGVWIVNYYCILYWLQPLLIGDRWIVREIPIPVAVATHLIFGWTMWFVDRWGRFEPPAQHAH